MIDVEALDLKANLGAFSTFDSEIVMTEVERLKPGQVYLEVGVDKGKSLSIARMVAQEGVEVYGVDLRDDPMIPNTHFLHGDSSEIASAFGEEISVIFIDGDHTYEGCKADIDAWYPHMTKDGVMTFHDCDATSPGVEKAVAEFAKKNNLEVWYSPNQRCSMARIRLNA